MPVETLRWAVSADPEGGAYHARGRDLRSPNIAGRVGRTMTWEELVRLIFLNAEDVTRPADREEEEAARGYRPYAQNVNNSTGWFRPELLHRYGIRGIDLLVVPRFDLARLINLVPDAKELALLGLTAEVLAKWYHMRAYHLSAFWIEPEAWRNVLGLTGPVLMRDLDAKPNDIKSLLSSERPMPWRWTPRDFVHMKLSATEMTSLGFAPRR